jgi:Ca2+-binding RTX toxin-like protein
MEHPQSNHPSDLIVGAKYANLSGKSNAGKSYVVFGKTDTNAIDLAKLGGNPKHTIDYLGDKNANTFTGTSRDEIFVAGAGNDTLTGLRILVLVEASNRSFRLSFKVLLPEPLISIINTS